MNLDDLTYFLVVADTGLLHRAATQIGVSQPALTKAVRRLETQLGVSLFERSPKGMQLTRYGVEFQRHASSLRAAYENTLTQIAEMHSGELAQVRVGATPATEPLVGRTFLSLLKKRPALRLGLIVQLSDSLIRALLEGEIDLAVAPMPVNLPDDLRAVPLLNESTSLVCRKGHPLLAKGKTMAPKDLADYPWILPSRSVSARQQIEAYFQRYNLDGPRVQVQSNYSSPVGVFYLIVNTDMVGICSTQHRPIAEQLGLEVLPASHANWPREIACLVRKNGSLSPLTSTFMEQLGDETVQANTSR
ncbi:MULTISPECIES: LysR family transcriptional regulator [unclassified Caballeronia]|uniref:LysR family transcriptional regulator n=1 Tax=unclassified Caballeronia TaxID=2646786 RepID=UPI0020288882|nr:MULTISPECIES: LysR family transcriptional regulator [unclassified Caballeronia]